jgi:hypothetical protein
MLAESLIATIKDDTGVGRTADLIKRAHLAVKIKPERLKQRDPKDLSLNEYVKYYLPKLRMSSHYWRDHGCGYCLDCDCMSVTGSVCLKPLASVSELNEYLFLPLLRSGSLSGL